LAAKWMYSKSEYIGPDYHQNLMVSLSGYPRGYTRAAAAVSAAAAISAAARPPLRCGRDG